MLCRRLGAVVNKCQVTYDMRFDALTGVWICEVSKHCLISLSYRRAWKKYFKNSRFLSILHIRKMQFFIYQSFNWIVFVCFRNGKRNQRSERLFDQSTEKRCSRRQNTEESSEHQIQGSLLPIFVYIGCGWHWQGQGRQIEAIVAVKSSSWRN